MPQLLIDPGPSRKLPHTSTNFWAHFIPAPLNPIKVTVIITLELNLHGPHLRWPQPPVSEMLEGYCNVHHSETDEKQLHPVLVPGISGAELPGVVAMGPCCLPASCKDSASLHQLLFREFPTPTYQLLGSWFVTHSVHLMQYYTGQTCGSLACQASGLGSVPVWGQACMQTCFTPCNTAEVLYVPLVAGMATLWRCCLNGW